MKGKSILQILYKYLLNMYLTVDSMLINWSIINIFGYYKLYMKLSLYYTFAMYISAISTKSPLSQSVISTQLILLKNNRTL